MKQKNCVSVAAIRFSQALKGLALIASLALPTSVVAELNTGPGGWVAGMLSSGSSPFDHLDADGANNVVRTHDSITYRVGFTTVNGSDTNARIRLQAGSFTLPPAYVGPALSSIGFFDAIDIPTSCTNASSTTVNDPPAPGVSGVTADGQTLYCAQPSPTSGNNLDFRFRISGSAPNGATVEAPIFSFTSNQTPTNSTPEVLTGISGSNEFFGLPQLTIVAAPTWNLQVTHTRNGDYLPASGPAGEDGFVFSWSLGVMGLGSRKGLEALQPPYQFNIDFSDSDFPNAQIVDWDMQNPGYVSANFSTTGSNPHNGCGNWYDQLSVSGNVFDNRHYQPNDKGSPGFNSAPEVSNGGDCQLTSISPAAFSAQLSTNGTDFSLQHWPTKKGANPAAASLINESNLDDPSNQWWVANKSVLVWVPVSDVTVNASEFFTLSAQLTGLSTTGQSNSEPLATDNSSTPIATRRMSGSLSAVHSPPVWSNPFGLEFTQNDPVITSDSHVNQAAPDQVLASRIAILNSSTGALTAGHICDRVDNTRLKIFDTRDPSYTSSSQNIKDVLTGVYVRYLAGPAFPITWELGVSPPWSNYNTVDSEYGRPAVVGSAQSDNACGNTDAIWYSSIDALLAAEGPDALQKVTRVRGSYTSFPAGSFVLIYIPQQANTNFAFSGINNSTNTVSTNSFTQGGSTTDSMAAHQVLWQTNESLMFDNGVGKASDAVRIMQTEYARISKSSSTHTPNGTLANVGDSIQYVLDINLSTSGSTHTSNVTVWDVLPNHLFYVPGSSTLGGAILSDPICSDNLLPETLFPSTDGVPAGSIANGYKACFWELPNQQVTKASIGHSSADLPALEYQARLALNAPSGSQVLTSAMVTSSNNLLPLAKYSGNSGGFSCQSGQACDFSNWTVNVQATPGLVLNKSISSNTVQIDGILNYTLSYGSVGESLNAVRIIDIFPYTGDPRSPGSSFSGTVTLAQPISSPAANAAIGTSTDNNFVTLYTRQIPNTVNADPYHTSHRTDGLGTNSIGETNWCSTLQFGIGNCPSNLAEATAVILLPDGSEGASATLAEGNSYRVQINLQTQGNEAGDVYSNSFTADSPTLTARRPSSNTVSSTVKAPDLVLTKTVTPDTATVSDTVSFEVVVKNNSGSFAAPIYASSTPSIRMVDALPTGLSLATAIPTATDWNCAATAGNTVDCSYTGSYPIGTGAAIGAPITFDATVDNSVADNAWLKNRAIVTLTGVTDADASNNEDEAWVRAFREVDLTLSKSASASTVTQTKPIDYTLKARVNTGGGRAMAGPIVVTDNLPAGISISSASDVSGTDWDCSNSSAPATVSCTYSGSYPVEIDTQIGSDITINATVDADATVGSISNTASVSIAAEQDTSNNSGTSNITVTEALASISGQVFLDADASGTLNSGDSGLEHVDLSLCRVAESPCSVANTVATATSDTSGAYQFDAVAQGSYFVVQSQAVGYGSSTDNTVAVTRSSDTAVSNVDFGETLGQLSGFVYADIDTNGSRAASGENGTGLAVDVVLRGTAVNYTNGQDLPVEIRVAADPSSGAYAFSGLLAPKAGTHYTLTQEPGTLANFGNGTTQVGQLNATGNAANTAIGSADSANNRISGIRFVPATDAQTAFTIDGQNYNFGEIPQASISGRVYIDSNANGSNDATDTGLENSTVILCRVDETPCSAVNTAGSTTTAVDGGYLFNNIATGTYYVQQQQPASYGSSSANSVEITRTGTQAIAGIDFIERAATIAGQVFIDVDKSGNRGPDDTDYTQATAEVTLQGTTADGAALLKTAVVDATGHYSFTDLAAPDASGYSLSLDSATVTAPFFAAAAHSGTVMHSDGSAGNSGAVSALSMTGLSWQVDPAIGSGTLATGFGYDFSVMRSVHVSGRVMRDVNANGSGNTTTDPADQPQADVTITLCRTNNNPCPAANTVESVQSNAQGLYQFTDVMPGSYWAIQTQPTTLGNGPGATDSVAVTVGASTISNLNFLDRAASLTGTVFSDKNANGTNDGEAGVEGITITLTGTDASGNGVRISAQTQADGTYQLADIPAPNASGYTLTQSNEPSNTRDGLAFSGNIFDALGNAAGPSGVVSSADQISAIQLVAGGAGQDYDFSELPATASVSGSVWRDRDSDRTYQGDEDAVPGWTVQLLYIDPIGGGTSVVAEQITGADGKYVFTSQVPGEYQIVFRAPSLDINGEPAIWGTPVNGERGAPVANSNADIGDGIIRSITLRADEHIPQQSLPLDPSGVVYDSITREPVNGAKVTLVGPAGFDPATHLLGGLPVATQTTGDTGEYQFLLYASAPAGEYSLDITPPAGYTYASLEIPAESGALTPPNFAALVLPVVPSEMAPAIGEPTTYYTRFNLTPGVSSGVVHNHIPVDPILTPVLFVSKQADRTQVEVGDSLKYTIRMYNRGTGEAPDLSIEDVLPHGMRYIEGTAKIRRGSEEEQTQPDPIGAPGPALFFNIEGVLGAGEELQLSYRVRAGVGSDRGDGINRATGLTGTLRSEEAQARVVVSGGVLGDEACLTGRIFVDCNGNHIQDSEEPGIPGVRLYMEDGRYLVADVEGKYSSCDLTPQTHVLKVDPMTLPRGSRLVTSSNRNVGDANSLFVDLKAGELHRADFIEGSCSSTVLEQIRARRSNGEVLQAQIEAANASSLSLSSNSAAVQRGTVSADQALVRTRPVHGVSELLRDTQDQPILRQHLESGGEHSLSEAQGQSPHLIWDASQLHTVALDAATDHSLADGLGAVAVTLTLKDEHGQRLVGRQVVTLTANGAQLLLPKATTAEAGVRGLDIDPFAAGIQTWVQDGELQFQVLAPDQPKTVKVQAIAAGKRQETEIEFSSALRDWIAAGLVEGIVRLNDRGALQTGSSDNGLFERELQEWQQSFSDGKGHAGARAAFFVKGTIKGKYLLTASYDSDKPNRIRVLQDIKPEQLYPVFGDASVKGFEAQSSGKLFVRVARGKHYLLYGDFQSDSGSSDLGAYNRTLTGARLHLDGDKGLLDIYAANDSLHQRVEELSPNGTSGPFGLRHSAVENTERVELIVRDRNLRTHIIERRTLTRLVDYSFDAFTGRLLFKEPVSRIDENGNPQSIRVSYEQDSDDASQLSAGVRGELQINERFRLGGSYISNDLESVSQDQLSELASADITVAITEWLELKAEAAQSTTLAADGSGEFSGDAARVELQAGSPAGSWSAALHAVQTDEDFRNANASAEAGRGEIGLRLQAAISENFSLNTEILHSNDETSGAETDSAYLGFKLRPREGLAVHAGLRHLQDNGRGLINGAALEGNGSVYTGSGLNNAGAGLFSNGQAITSTVDGDALESTSLLLGADWAATDKLALGVEVENSFDGDESWRASAKAGWKLNDRHTLQARVDTQTGLGSDVDRQQKSSTFVFGLTRNFDEDGSNFTELRLRDSIGGREAHLAYGVRNGFDLGSGLRGIASIEQVAILDGEGRTATSGALGLSHTGGDRWKGTARVEARRLHDDEATAGDDSADSWLASVSVARKLDDRWTALAKASVLGSDNKAQAGDQSQQRVQVGAAYRPVDNNRVAVVGKLEHRRERNSELATAESRDLWVASVNSNWHPTRAWWLGARLAAKDVDESLEGVQDNYQASLVGVRATYDITERVDVGMIGSYRYSPDGGTKEWSAGVEAGYAVKTNLWLSLGYNWGGFSDKDLSGADYTQHGWYIRLRYKFDEDIFNGTSPSVNRSRARSSNQQENEQ